MMNGVFHSLRGEFDLHETYTGSAVLSIIVNTIKVLHLCLTIIETVISYYCVIHNGDGLKGIWVN